MLFSKMLTILFVLMLFAMCEGKPSGLAHARRGLCPEGGGDQKAGCGYWKKLGYCDPKNGYGSFMEATCPATCGLCQARPTPPPIIRAVKVNIQECLQAHNAKRALHGAEPLTWDTSLASDAQAYAVRLATENKFEHSGIPGENLYTVTEDPTGNTATCREAVEKWYAEVKDYNFRNPPNSVYDTTAGHFTQVVWKSTRRLGVGIATRTIKKGSVTYVSTFTVARYSPPGNYEGRFGQQVGDSIMA